MSEKIYPIDATLTDVAEKKCPILYAMEVIGSKYKLPLMWYLHEKDKTHMMLAKSLREMEADGLVVRCELVSAPPKVVEYSLTPLGKELIPALNELYTWGQKVLARKNS